MRTRVIFLVGNTRLRSLLPELRKLFSEHNPALKLPLAISMALLGDDSGKAILKQAMQTLHAPVLPAVAVALGAIGDQSGTYWLMLNLISGWRTDRGLSVEYKLFSQMKRTGNFLIEA